MLSWHTLLKTGSERGRYWRAWKNLELAVKSMSWLDFWKQGFFFFFGLIIMFIWWWPNGTECKLQRLTCICSDAFRMSLPVDLRSCHFEHSYIAYTHVNTDNWILFWIKHIVIFYHYFILFYLFIYLFLSYRHSTKEPWENASGCKLNIVLFFDFARIDFEVFRYSCDGVFSDL